MPLPFESLEPPTFPYSEGYKGLYSFHKYWGKKPRETVASAINALSEPGQVVIDPFVGSGVSGREAILLRRRFIGFDINPIAVELTKLLISPPSKKELKLAATKIDELARKEILQSYALYNSDEYASHYLWEGAHLAKVWTLSRRKRIELNPTEHDLALSRSYSDFASRKIRAPQFFSNSRINSNNKLTLHDLLTGRAQRNIDILIDAINTCAPHLQPALMLCLTAASGQMSNMVFAINNRGKTRGESSHVVEVGSWVIGFWRPAIHFEINVWNCFSRRLHKLLKALDPNIVAHRASTSTDALDVISGNAQASVLLGDSTKLLADIPSSSVDLIITDPPHGDRIPYLELSELWNSILGSTVNFEDEIVISNAQERRKTADSYISSVQMLFSNISRVLTDQGYFVLIFNTRQSSIWEAILKMSMSQVDPHIGTLSYLGYFPCNYSASSVVQDNRKGSLNFDYAMVFKRAGLTNRDINSRIVSIPGWQTEFP